MKIDPFLAKELRRLSRQMDSNPQELLASLLWIAKVAMGRKIKIDSSEEAFQLVIDTFSHFPKLSKITYGTKTTDV